MTTLSPLSARMRRFGLMPLMLMLLMAPSVWGQGARAWAWVQSTAPALNMFYNYNSAGGVNSVSLASTGSYLVVFPGVYPQYGGNVQVTAYGGSHHCTVAYWSALPAPDLTVAVKCYNTSGALVNGAFTVLYYAEPAAPTTRNAAYFWLSETEAPKATPSVSAVYSWNSKGNSNTVRHTGLGTYVAVLGGLTPEQAHAHVTAYAQSGSCHTQGISVVGGNLEVGVRCFNAAGSPVDSAFTFSVMSDLVVGGDPASPKATAYAMAEQPSAASYTPSTANNLQTAGTILATRSAVGNYAMEFSNLYVAHPGTDTVVVTAHGPAAGVICSVVSWNTSATGIKVFTQCRDAAGAFVDSVYQVLVVSNGSTVVVPPISISGVTTGSEFGGGFANFASGSYIEIKGVGLADTTRSWEGADFTDGGQSAPTVLDGVRVTINGITAFPYYVSPTQLNVHTPADVATGNAEIRVTVGSRSATFSAPKLAVAPGVLTPAVFRVDGRQYAVATFSDRFYVGRVGLVTGSAFRPARPGDTITLYGIGFGDVLPASQPGRVVAGLNELARPLTVSFGQIPATLSYRGLAPGLVGLYQFNVVVPANLPSGDYKINMTLGGQPLTQPEFYLTVQGN